MYSQFPLSSIAEEQKGKLYQFRLGLSETSLNHTVIPYGFMDFISDIAGVAELLMFIFGLFMWPLSA